MQTNGVTLTLGNLSPKGALAVIEAYKDAEKGAGVSATAVEYRETPTATTTATPRKRGRPAKTETVEDAEQLEMIDDTAEAEELDASSESADDELGFDQTDEDEAPAKTAKKKPVKLTEADVNEACKAHARKHGRPATFEILKKKFKVKSLLELSADQYPAVVAAMKV